MSFHFDIGSTSTAEFKDDVMECVEVEPSTSTCEQPFNMTLMTASAPIEDDKGQTSNSTHSKNVTGKSWWNWMKTLANSAGHKPNILAMKRLQAKMEIEKQLSELEEATSVLSMCDSDASGSGSANEPGVLPRAQNSSSSPILVNRSMVSDTSRGIRKNPNPSRLPRMTDEISRSPFVWQKFK